MKLANKKISNNNSNNNFFNNNNNLKNLIITIKLFKSLAIKIKNKKNQQKNYSITALMIKINFKLLLHRVIHHHSNYLTKL